MQQRRASFISAALRHTRDAEHLLASGPHRSLDQAFHLAGFGPECARKACLSESWADKTIATRSSVMEERRPAQVILDRATPWPDAWPDSWDELREEHPVVTRLEHLRGQTVMLERRMVEQLLARPAAHEDGFGDGSLVVEELIRLGVLSVRTDGRVDVPDIYRYGFQIKRKGGVARPR